MRMKATLTISTRKGFYHESTITGVGIQNILDKVLPALDASPDEVDGVQGMDWTTTTLVITKLK